MPKYFSKWKLTWVSLTVNQKFSLVLLLLIVIIFPVAVIVAVKPKSLLFPKATHPITPQITFPYNTPYPTQSFGQTSILAVLFNDHNQNLTLDPNEELITGVNATVWACRLDQYDYACDLRYPTGVGYTYGNSFTVLNNITPGTNEVWVHTYSSYQNS